MRSAEGEAGYTLSEMLAALFIVSLAMGGALQAGFLLERQQRSTVSQTRTLDGARNTAARFEALLNAYEPTANGAVFEGEPQRFSFPCVGQTCSAQLAPSGDALRLEGPHPTVLPLSGVHRPRFAYLGGGVESDRWPVASSHPKPLQAVLLLDEGHEDEDAVLTARIWREEPRGCRFDVIARACRGASS